MSKYKYMLVLLGKERIALMPGYDHVADYHKTLKETGLEGQGEVITFNRQLAVAGVELFKRHGWGFAWWNIHRGKELNNHETRKAADLIGGIDDMMPRYDDLTMELKPPGVV